MTITSSDIKTFKKELKSVVEKLIVEKRLATKKDLSVFATRDDLKSYVTKDYLDLKLDIQKEEIIEEFKKFRSDFYDKIDPILKEVKDSRDERTILSAHSKDHTDRIEKLEKIHPQGKHLATI